MDPDLFGGSVKQTAYSLVWARRVAEALWRTYPRGANIIELLTGVSLTLSAQWLARNQYRWKKYHHCVEQMEKYVQRCSPEGIPPQNWSEGALLEAGHRLLELVEGYAGMRGMHNYELVDKKVRAVHSYGAAKEKGSDRAAREEPILPPPAAQQLIVDERDQLKFEFAWRY